MRTTPAQLFRAVTSLSLLALMVLTYVDIVYLPQKKMLDEQHTAIAALSHELHSLRADNRDHEALKKRVRALEAALLKKDPTLAAEVGLEAAKKAPLPEAPPPELPPAASGAHPPAALAAAPEPTAKPAAPKRQNAAAAATTARWRADFRCGAKAQQHGRPAECNPDSDAPCCSPGGWCGASKEHCECEGCVDYRDGTRASAPSPDLTAYKEETSKAIALVIPFRDRGVHLERFRERIQSHVEAWNARGVGHAWVVFVVEQFDNALFNRGWLFNVGFHFASEYAKKTGTPFDCVVMHDIDILPQPVVDYGWCLWPTQLSGEIECWSWSVPYPDNVGGVTSLSPHHWTTINGFSNEYEGWGGEDDDLYYRLRQNSLLKGDCHTWCKDAKRPTVPMVHRPPLGRGRFTCLHDGDHTPRQRAPNDAPMWSRLNAMKSNSKRWRSDGISSLTLHSAGAPLWSGACGSCSAPEDPIVRRRLFSEMWVRVSSKQVGKPDRIEVKLLAGAGCNGTSRPLASIPAGLESLRGLLVDMFGAECRLNRNAAKRISFLLVDVDLGQALVVGEGAQLVVPDSSLPALPVPGEEPQSPPAAGSEHLMQGQRLSRWIRRLPQPHRGWIIAEEMPSAKRQRYFVDQGHRVPLTAPVCISRAAFDGSRKYRATPGTTWCGDGGWNHEEHFLVLRSKTSVPKDEIVPICIAYNPDSYVYRFEQSEDGCAGKHRASGVTWRHASTIHTSKDATGTRMCVGVHEAGDTTRWIMAKGDSCNKDGFTHTFSFSAMAANAFQPPLARCCLLVADSTTKGGQAVKRLAGPEQCSAPPAQEALALGPWKRDREVLLLARRLAPTDVQLCPAEGTAEPGKHDKEASLNASAPHSRIWRVFRGEACSKSKFFTHESDGRKVHWSVELERPLFAASSASGPKLCLCLTQTGVQKKGGPGFTYSWAEGECRGKGAKRELSFHEMTVADALRYVHLIDEVT